MKPILRKGELSKWNDDRGFGFIKPSDGGKEVFLHISALKKAIRRPQIGDTIFYEITTEADGKIRAVNASIAGVKLAPAPSNQPKAKVNRSRIKTRLIKILIVIPIWFVIAAIGKFQASRSPSPVQSIVQPGCSIKGNVSVATGAKLYHVPGMEDYDSTTIDPARGERWFCSEQEAIANGWHRAPR
ncbi:MAG: cold shock domain-containing protein [Microcoleus sp. SIO2G3]|nr:cold shock domain-containing protein [Microcoleus sp. SIO2G3]